MPRVSDERLAEIRAIPVCPVVLGDDPLRWVVALTEEERDDLLADLEEARAARLDVRPEVAAFALAMEERLRANDHKPGWKNDDLSSLRVRFNQESFEFVSALIDHIERDGHWRPEQLRHEAADVANFLMMILDVAGALAATEQEEKP